MKKFVSKVQVQNKKDEKIAKLQSDIERLSGQIEINQAKIKSIEIADIMATKQDLMQMYIQGKFQQHKNEEGKNVIMFDPKYYSKDVEVSDFSEMAYIYGELEEYPIIEIMLIDEE